MSDPSDGTLPFSQHANLGMPFPLNACNYEQIADAVGPEAAGIILAGRPFRSWEEVRVRLGLSFGERGQAIVNKLIGGGVTIDV
jgi:hypothetical protein